MHNFTGKTILIMAIIAFILGLGVVLFKPGYTRADNVWSNRDYYPSVKVPLDPDFKPPTEGRKSGEAGRQNEY